VLKGGPGNDAIDGGIGDDILLGGDGQDFINGGANDNETFAGPGNDFIIAGQGADAVFGDGGDDWIQGGSGQDLLQGDHGAPFFDDPAEKAPGNDIFIGQVGENDYDAEGGDDIMAQNAAIDRNAGAAGFDWAIHQYDTVGANDDMEINNNLVGVPVQVVVNRDRWQEVEANSGSAFNDVIKGTSVAPATIGGAGFAGCNALDPAGVRRIKGLDALVTTFPSALSTIVTNSAAGYCPLAGAPAVAGGPEVNGAGTVWGEGDILLGGPGSDNITGRGADDIIDGDRALTVRISVRTNPADAATEIGSADLMEHQYLRDASGNLTGPTLQAAVFAGTVDPGNLVAVREIKNDVTAAADCGTTNPVNCDTAEFAGPRANYTVAFGAGKVTVTQTGANVVGQKVSDGVDTLRNIEALKFSDQTVQLRAPGAPTIGTASTTASSSAVVTWTAPAANGGPAISSYEIVVSVNGTAVRTLTAIPATARTRTVTLLTNGTTYTFQVRAVNAIGASPLSAPSNAVTPLGLATAPTGVSAARGNASAFLSWTPPNNDGGSPITGYQIQVRTGGALIRTDSITGAVSGTTVNGLTNGTSYNFRVLAVTARGLGAVSGTSNNVTPATVSDAPGILAPTQGAAGGNLTALANWSTPAFNGGSAILGYRVTAQRMAADGVTVISSTVALVGSTIRSRSFTLAAGNYRFQVVATNGVGDSAPATSTLIAPR
jgi:Ca2+-binding RTX toxin-like protein